MSKDLAEELGLNTDEDVKKRAEELRDNVDDNNYESTVVIDGIELPCPSDEELYDRWVKRMNTK